MKHTDLAGWLEVQPDFKESKTLVEEEMAVRGAKVLFLPKYSPELNPMEFHYRDIAARNRRLNLHGSSSGFLGRVMDSYSEITAQSTRKYFLSVDKFANIYSSGLTGSEALKSKLTLSRKSHRRFGGIAPTEPDHKKKRYSRVRFSLSEEVEEEGMEEEGAEEEGVEEEEEVAGADSEGEDALMEE